MKARLLKKMLNNTPYNIADYGDCIGIGNSLMPKLFSVNKKTLEMHYALDTNGEGRNSVIGRMPLFIWDKVQTLIMSGKMTAIISGNDIIENPLPVFSFINGELLETTTDAYGWPNVTAEGYMMYDGGWFETKKEAIEYGLKQCILEEQFCIDQLKRLNDQRIKTKKELISLQDKINDFKSQLKK